MHEIKLAKRVYIIFLSFITLLMGSSLLWNIKQEQEYALELARTEAMASFNKDLLYRRFAAMHGGVYVPITANTPPNPYLTQVKDKIITTPSGVKLTLIDPAYMTRQVHELVQEQYKVKGHITSLKPIRPANKPDLWEYKALKRFEQGDSDYSSIEHVDGKPFLRYMHSMITEKKCMKCHEQQGYHVGDIRGGISVTVPLDTYFVFAKHRSIEMAMGYGAFYLVLLVISWVIFVFLRRQLEKRAIIQQQIIESEQQLKEQNNEFKKLNEEYKRQNTELVSAKERAEESDQLKTAFLQNMSHEIRTPLNAISGFTEILLRQGLAEEKRQSYSAIVKNSSNQLLSIINDILTVSAIDTHQEKLSLQAVCINDVLKELYVIFKSQTDAKRLDLSYSAGLPDEQSVTYADKTKLIQVLTNLISNAIKFTHEGGISFGYMLKEKTLHFYVKDSGIGIFYSDQQKIFKRFYQVHAVNNNNQYGGTGLGLSICKAFVELMGGQLAVYSQKDEGAEFSFTLPYVVPELKEGLTPEKIDCDEQYAILIAEDEEYNFMYLEELLMPLQCRIVRAKNGREAIDFCLADRSIQLVLMDIKMPVLNGYAAAIEIKKLLPNLPIIAQSAYTLAQDRERYSELSFDDFISKPISEELLMEKINKYCKKRKA